MKDKIEEAVKLLSINAGNSQDATEAMKFAQAALNLTQVLATLEHTKQLVANGG